MEPIKFKRHRSSPTYFIDGASVNVPGGYYYPADAVDRLVEAADKTIKEFERKQERNAFLINELMGLRAALAEFKGGSDGR